MLKLILIIIVTTCSLALKAQQLFNNDAELNNGIYLNIEEFINNKPSIKLSEVELNYTDGVFDSEHAKVLDIFKGNVSINDKVWGICAEGNVYLRLATIRKDSLDKLEQQFINENIFSKIILKGELSTFSLPIYVSYSNTAGVFGGIGGIYGSGKKSNAPKLSSNHETDNSKTKWYFLSLKNGSVYRLELEPFLNYLQNNELGIIVQEDEKASKKLLYYINKYNEKNPFYIQPANENY